MYLQAKLNKIVYWDGQCAYSLLLFVMEDKLDRILENQEKIMQRLDNIASYQRHLRKEIENPHFFQNLLANLLADGIWTAADAEGFIKVLTNKR